MNILFTCAGRRNYLLQYFKRSIGKNGLVLAADMEPTAPALAFADKGFIVPGVYEEDYLQTLLDICKKERIRALISLNDLELPLLASAHSAFKNIGTILVVSNQQVVNLCFDKFKTLLFCKSIHVKHPGTYLNVQEVKNALKDGLLHFPLVVKPRWGSASIGIEIAEDLDNLELCYRLLEKKITRSILFQASKEDISNAILIQEKLNGIEYGLDILNDFDGIPKQVFVKEKLSMRAGETDKAVLRNNAELTKLGFLIGERLGHVGNLDCDIFEVDGEYYLLEMNPRFGGGYPFSHEAGADYPAAILSWLKNKPYNFNDNLKKYDQPFAKCDILVKVAVEK